jgi:hypothetical protein
MKPPDVSGSGHGDHGESRVQSSRCQRSDGLAAWAPSQHWLCAGVGTVPTAQLLSSVLQPDGQAGSYPESFRNSKQPQGISSLTCAVKGVLAELLLFSQVCRVGTLPKGRWQAGCDNSLARTPGTAPSFLSLSNCRMNLSRSLYVSVAYSLSTGKTKLSSRSNQVSFEQVNALSK